MVTEQTCKEQILYEIQDPQNYFTPDCIADFSNVWVEQVGKDRVKICGATGKVHNGKYKTSIGFKDCFIGEGQISYGGSTALERARLAGEILKKRLEITGCEYEELRIDNMGVDSLYGECLGNCLGGSHPSEVRLRIAVRTKDKSDNLVWEDVCFRGRNSVVCRGMRFLLRWLLLGMIMFIWLETTLKIPATDALYFLFSIHK